MGRRARGAGLRWRRPRRRSPRPSSLWPRPAARSRRHGCAGGHHRTPRRRAGRRRERETERRRRDAETQRCRDSEVQKRTDKETTKTDVRARSCRFAPPFSSLRHPGGCSHRALSARGPLSSLRFVPRCRLHRSRRHFKSPFRPRGHSRAFSFAHHAPLGRGPTANIPFCISPVQRYRLPHVPQEPSVAGESSSDARGQFSVLVPVVGAPLTRSHSPSPATTGDVR